ncbi:hypothetical protein N7519_003559 [Penicillium mononematosum]|uniref:uncharacterized protein n=1 Tax=Penicillium mononematosum TaxID=268346 RepID=UPI00254817C5|nr:uncharacterized protein N7519_003559 [Penicillium mononematosum]KAJ6188651.1 hypothetical protein N7519_003559 [Penicillium mononematosum]
MFGSFSPDLLADCDYIDAIANKVTTIAHKDLKLNTPEAKRILRLNEEILQDHQDYNGMVFDMAQRLALREDWQRCILQNAFDSVRQTYTDTYGASGSDEESADDDAGTNDDDTHAGTQSTANDGTTGATAGSDSTTTRPCALT